MILGKRCHNLEVVCTLVGPSTPREVKNIISVALGPNTYHGKVESVVSPVPELIPQPYTVKLIKIHYIVFHVNNVKL